MILLPKPIILGKQISEQIGEQITFQEWENFAEKKYHFWGGYTLYAIVVHNRPYNQVRNRIAKKISNLESDLQVRAHIREDIREL